VNRCIVRFALILLCITGSSLGAFAPGARTLSVPLRGKNQPVMIYDPANGAGNGTDVLVVSGDVGWMGLSASIAEHLQTQGFRVIGFNARAYLSSFTAGKAHLREEDVPSDFNALLNAAMLQQDERAVVIGVSEGAGLAVLALAQSACPKCRGLIALGLPERTSMAWRWTDFTMWITKTDPNEPMAYTPHFLSRLKVPVVMIHSTHDEWDPIEKAR